MDYLKNDVLLPLIKELDNYVDEENKKNYRPVSNLWVNLLKELIIRLNQQSTIYIPPHNLATKRVIPRKHS